MAEQFTFKKSKEDLKEMRDLLLDIRTDIKKNKDEVLDWTNAEKNLNLELEKIVKGMDETELSTQRSVTAINAARAGTLSVHDAGKMLINQSRDLAAEKQKLASWEYGHAGRVGGLQKELDAEAKNGLTDKFYQIQANLAAEKESHAEQIKKVEAIEQEGDILKGLQGHAIMVEASKERQNNLQEIDNKLLGGAVGKYKELAKTAKTSWGMAAIGVGAVIALVMALATHTNQIGNEFGAIGTSDFRSDLMSATASAQQLGYDFSEVAGSVRALSDNFGVAVGDSIEISKSSMDTARALGISTEEAATLTGMLMTMGGHSAETAQNFMKQAEGLAKSAGVAPGTIMKDLAQSSKEIAGFTKGTGENMAQAAVKARSMGMALSDVATIAEGLLDFQSSLEAEMTASVMIGRQLNLQKARELALAGDLAGLQDEILKQVGSEEEFLSMNVLQRKALADSIGVGVDQMAKMVSHAGKSKKELMAMSDIDISQIVSANAIADVTRLTNQLKAWGTEALAWIARFIDSENQAVLAFKLLGAGLVGMIMWRIGKTLIQIGLTKIQISLENKLGDSKLKTTRKSKGGGLLGGMKPTQMLAGAASILILSAAMFVAAKAFQEFGSVSWTAVAMGLGTIVVLSIMARILSKGAKEMMVGALAVAVLGAALIPATYAFSLLAGVDPMSIIAFSASLIVLGAAVFGLGLLMFTGVGALVFGAGILALLSLGAAVMTLGIGMSLASPHLVIFTTFLTGLGSTLESVLPHISDINLLGDSLRSLAGGLAMVGVAGIMAAPSLLLLNKLGLLGGEGDGTETKTAATEKDPLLLAVEQVRDEIKFLVKGFGGKPGADGVYIADFANKIPKKTQIDSGII